MIEEVFHDKAPPASCRDRVSCVADELKSHPFSVHFSD